MSGKFEHIPILDGWRALSILAVIGGHWLPLGPASWGLNAAFAASGMAIFFSLSGFLITQFLFYRPQVGPFLIRRITRIVPLAWGAMIILALATGASADVIIANLAFYANLPPARLMEGGHHLWSLCLEVQFYFFTAVIVLLFGRKALYTLPLLCLAVTGLRIADGEVISIITWHRVDEILIGSCVALCYNHGLLDRVKHLPTWVVPALFVALILVALPSAGPMGYLRPYVTGAMVGISIYTAPRWLQSIWTGPIARYIANISYAVYVVHGMLGATWLGGEQTTKIVKYILRIPLALLTWLISDLSTRYYERFFTDMGRRWTRSGKAGAS